MKNYKSKIFIVIVLTVCLTLFCGGSYYITTIFPMLGPGSKGPEVSEMQQRLKNWEYYDGDVNGVYNFETLLAVRAFQQCYGIPSHGIANRDTLISMGMIRTVREGTAYAQGNGTSDEQLLARAINGEARGEPYEGQVAVGAVILNRTRDPAFPKTIAGVIYQPGAFTAVSDGQINVPIDASSSVVEAARDALNGWDPTNGCIYYWNPATATSSWIWSRQIVKTIGKHHFGK